MATASEYWGPLERLLSEATAVLDPATEIPAMLVAAGFVSEQKRDEAAELLSQHQYGWSESDYDDYCQCGKWLEVGYYEIENHQAAVLKDAGLLLERE